MIAGLVAVCLIACPAVPSAQDERLPVVRPQLEMVKASPSPFPFADKTAADYDTWIRTAWIQMNRARCDRDCLEIAIRTATGLVQVDTSSAKKGFAKLRLGMVIPQTCGDAVWYGEMRDQDGTSGAGVQDPSPNPIPLSKIHVFRFDERGREVSMVFQNEHPASLRQARLNVLCKSKP